VLTVYATSANKALAGIVFDVLLIARAPLQLFQAIQTSLLPHLTGLEATAGHAAFARAIRVTVLAITAFAAAVALGLRQNAAPGAGEVAEGPAHVFSGRSLGIGRDDQGAVAQAKRTEVSHDGAAFTAAGNIKNFHKIIITVLWAGR